MNPFDAWELANRWSSDDLWADVERRLEGKIGDVLGVFDPAGKMVAAYRQDRHGVGVMRTTRVGDVYQWLGVRE